MLLGANVCEIFVFIIIYIINKFTIFTLNKGINKKFHGYSIENEKIFQKVSAKI